MRASARYAFFHARTAMLAGRLMALEQAARWVEAPPEQAEEFARQHGLERTILTQPDALERALVGMLLRDAMALVRPLTGAAREFYLHWMRRHEISNLKAIIRAKRGSLESSAISGQLVDIAPYGTLPTAQLLAATDLPEFLRRLELVSGYGDMARHARHVFEMQQDTFALDAALDREFYAGLFARAEAVNGTQLRKLVGSLIDRINLVWLLRYRFVYRLPPPEAYYLLVPANHRLGSQDLLSLARLDSFAEVLSAVPEPFHTLLAGTTTIAEATGVLRNWTWRLAESVLRHTVFDVAEGFAYLLLRDRELRRMRAIVKGRLLGISAELVHAAIGSSHRPDGGTLGASGLAKQGAR